MRWSILALGVVFTSILSLFTSSPALFFFPNFVGIFWTTGMSTDPPNIRVVAALFSNISGKFLPAMFVAWVMFDKMGVRRTLGKLTAQIEKTVLWLGPCWVGALNNYTLSFIPIQRLNAHDLQQQPGAKAALAIIILILIVIAGFQVWYFREEGRFLKYIKLYALFIGSIVIFLLIPGLNLRLHHYILALLLLPGTSLQTRPSLIYQGLLVGLFINGVARWGFDPVLQTSAALRGDAPSARHSPPSFPRSSNWRVPTPAAPTSRSRGSRPMTERLTVSAFSLTMLNASAPTLKIAKTTRLPSPGPGKLIWACPSTSDLRS
uniref:Uncharacterized protein n=1 Tax=Bionectria ochroleuca TaxID=29856 RepID=A0A8H7NGB6_BIOOC